MYYIQCIYLSLCEKQEQNCFVYCMSRAFNIFSSVPVLHTVYRWHFVFKLKMFMYILCNTLKIRRPVPNTILYEQKYLVLTLIERPACHRIICLKTY